MIAASAVLLGAACGAAGNEAQPRPGASTFGEGAFDELPRFPRSDPLGTATEQNDVVAQSFLASGVTPRGILEFYEGELTGEVLAEPSEIGVDTWRGAWRWSDAQVLVVSATKETVGDDERAEEIDGSVQYSLSLGPAEAQETVLQAAAAPGLPG